MFERWIGATLVMIGVSCVLYGVMLWTHRSGWMTWTGIEKAARYSNRSFERELFWIVFCSAVFNCIIMCIMCWDKPGWRCF